jgi:hypothetical protein
MAIAENEIIESNQWRKETRNMAKIKPGVTMAKWRSEMKENGNNEKRNQPMKMKIINVMKIVMKAES